MKNGIIIPCFNEETSLNLVGFENFIDRHPNHMLCFVNHGSCDNTLEVLKNFHARLMNSHKGLGTQILIYNMPKKVASLTAVKAGVKHLLTNTLVKNIRIMAADLKIADADGTTTVKHKFFESESPLFAA